jgi:endo-1,4-beta-xylanase
MTHYRGQIFAWDVVNEAFNDDGTLGESPFLDQLGPSYIQTAFEIARSADPSARLYIVRMHCSQGKNTFLMGTLQNDFNTEGVNAKSDALLALVTDLKSQNLIDGVGFQSHFIVGEVPQDLQTNLERFVAAGVEVAITELDVRVSARGIQSSVMCTENSLRQRYP